MKLYIPTTSLNFNNILSTESISPKGFYALRGFGYSRWFTIPENDMDGVILLYESPAAFVRPQSDMEDHPLLIELDTDEEFPIAMEGVRYSKHSIYVNPWKTRFIFLNEEDRSVAYSLSDSSLETKMLRLYNNKIVVESIQGSFPVLKGLSEDFAMEESFIEQDQRINKIKGLLYGYYIGACLSSSKDYIEQINILKEIQNIFASVVSSLERTPSLVQNERLEHLFTSYIKQDPLYQELLAELGSFETTNNVLSILQKYGVKAIQFDWKSIVAELQQKDKEPNKAMAWIKSEIINLKREMASRKTLLSPDREEIITSNGRVSKVLAINNDESQLNNVLINSEFTGKVSSTKEELADAITKSAIDTLGAKWSDSPIRTFLNQLRKHVRGEEFTQPWNNGVLSSIAAVIAKGDDWENLLSFMQSKGMTDYRLAFSFYGILNGFANLTRDFTDILLNEKNTYFAEVYREFYGQLHGATIDIAKVETTSINIDNEKGKVEKEYSMEQQKKEIWDFFYSFAPKSGDRKMKLEKGLHLCLERYTCNINLSQFIMELKDFGEYGWKKTNKPWKSMQEHFYPNYKDNVDPYKNSIKKNTSEPSSLFDEEKENCKAISIIEDTAWIEKCVLLISDSRAQRQFVEDMKWFVENHNKTYNDKKKGIVPGYYAGHDCTNNRVKERLKTYMENKLKPRNEKMQWLSEIYAKIPIDRIIDYISKLYGI